MDYECKYRSEIIMEFISMFIKSLLERGLLPFLVSLAPSVIYLIYPRKDRSNKQASQSNKSKVQSDKPKRKTKNNKLPGAVIVYFLTIFIVNMVLTIYDISDQKKNNPSVEKDISITDTTFEGGTRGLVSLYDNELIPFWHESDLSDVCLHFWVDNSGTSHASIGKAKLIIDDFTPLSTDDILICRGEAFAGMPDIAEANIDLNDISEGRSEYDFSFLNYYDRSTGEDIPIEPGQTFYVDPSTSMYLTTALDLNRTGIYTYHLELPLKYYKDESTIKTDPVKFIYITGDYNDYKYNTSKLSSLVIKRECRNDDLSKTIHYNIEGRTLRIYDTKTIFSYTDFFCFFALVDTIIVEDGTKEIEECAFGDDGGLFNVKTIYLPKSLRSLDFDCFYNLDAQKLEKVYFGGSEAEWEELKMKSDNFRLQEGWDDLQNVEIIYNYDLSTFENELSNKPVDDNPFSYMDSDSSDY